MGAAERRPADMKINIVLFQPEIPQNTGNIARTCSATGSSLHLVHPLGFSLDEKHLRRAGLDYWYGLDIHQYEDDEDFFTQFSRLHPGDPIYFLSQKGPLSLWEVDFRTKPSGRLPAKASPDDLSECHSKADAVEPAPSGELWLAFGRESQGLGDDILGRHIDSCIRIPMIAGRRSLNLSNAVAVVVYEALRQTGGVGLVEHGILSGRNDA